MKKKIHLNRYNRRIILGYRKIQLMFLLHRKIYANAAIPSMVTLMTILNVLGIYNACMIISGKTANDFESPWQLKFVSVYGSLISSLVIMIGFLYLGKVHRTSVVAKAKLHKTKRSIELRRFLVACPIQKIFFGDLNYFETTTSLEIQEFAFEKTAALFLLK